jgi:type IV pilus assembly protein PilA
MNTLMSRYWEKRDEAKNEKGFTLIELLVVVVILGVLIAIAIPLYLNYRKGANDASAESDMRNAINVLEQCNTDDGKYPLTVTTSTNPILPCGTVQKINLSEGTTLTYLPRGSVGVGYIVTDINSSGNTITYCYDSAEGGAIVKVAETGTTETTGCVALP